MDKALLVIIASITAEAVVETAKMVWQEGKFSWTFLLSLAVGIAIAFSWPVDMFATLQFPFRIPWVGTFLTGILFARGSNYMHELVKRLIGPHE